MTAIHDTDNGVRPLGSVAAKRGGHPGRFIAIEGGDGAGRSTQVRQLLAWLNECGWATNHAGLGRSRLAAPAFREYKARAGTGPHALALLYAADLTAQAESVIRPALAAGFCVVADRWTGTATARCRVRGLDADYLRDIFPADPVPDLVVHLYARPRVRLGREVARGGLPSIPECGRDLPLHRDPVQSFLRYQGMLDRELRRLAPAGPWRVLASSADPGQVQQALRRLVEQCLREGGDADG